MTVKVFQTNKNGKIEFTRAELEKLLNDVYGDGYKAGEIHMRETYWTWTPSLTTTAQSLPITYRTDVTSTTNVVDGACADKVCTSLDCNKAETATAKSAIASKDYAETATSDNVTCSVSSNAAPSTSTARSVLFTPTQVVNIKGTSLADAVDAILNTAFRMDDANSAAKKSNDAYDKLAKELSNL